MQRKTWTDASLSCWAAWGFAWGMLSPGCSSLPSPHRGSDSPSATTQAGQGQDSPHGSAQFSTFGAPVAAKGRAEWFGVL